MTVACLPHLEPFIKCSIFALQIPGTDPVRATLGGWLQSL